MRKLFKVFVINCAILTVIMVPLFVEAAEAANDPYEIELRCGTVGLSTYIFMTAMSEILKKHSSWLKPASVESRGPVTDHKMVANNPALAKKFIYQLHTGSRWGARTKTRLYADVPYDFSRMRSIMLMSYVAAALVTLDPKIKTLKDLKGKRVAYSPDRGDYNNLLLQSMMEYEGMSIKDLKRLEYLRFKPSSDALRDGLLDACIFSMQAAGLQNEFKPPPFSAELLATKKVHFISYTPEAIKYARKKLGSDTPILTLKPFTVSPLQKKPYTMAGLTITFACDLAMPDHVVTEILRVAYEHIEEFADYLPQGKVLTRETMGKMSCAESSIHPAALKFYKEKGVPIGDLF